jgi:ferredoxin
MQINSDIIKEKARDFGADLVGIAPIERFAGTVESEDPRHIAPAAKSVIGLGFRVLRGSMRGIETGTEFFQYPSMGIRNIDCNIAPYVLRRVSCFLEDSGYEGVTLMAESDRRNAADTGTNPEGDNTHKYTAVPVAPGKPAPDVQIDFAQSAYLCGLGEIGMGGFFLTPEFGPLQRFAFILTDVELEPDPIVSSTLCDQCGKCVEACPGKAIIREITEREWDGEKVPSWTLDEWQCSAYYSGCCSELNPFLPPDALDSLPYAQELANGEKRLTPEEAQAVKKLVSTYYGGVGFNVAACICGKACQKECFIHLSESNALSHKFKNPFRIEEKWRITNK